MIRTQKDFYNFGHPKGLEPFLQHFIVSSETLLHSQFNDIADGSLVPERLIRSKNPVNSTGVSSVSSRQKYSGGELSGGLTGSHQKYRKFGVSLYRNTPKDSGSNSYPNHPLQTSPLLAEVPPVTILKETAEHEYQGKNADHEYQGKNFQGLSESRRQLQ